MEVTKGAQPGNPVAPDEKLATWRAKAVFYGEAAMRFLLLERRLAHDPIRADLIRHAHLDVRRALHFAILYVEGWGTVEPMSKTRRERSGRDNTVPSKFLEILFKSVVARSG